MGKCMCDAPPECKQKESCYRYRKIPHDKNQAYMMMFEPHPNDPSIRCVSFCAIEGRTDIEVLR